MKNFNFWIKICLFNFFVISVLGVMMRYNMAFSLPGFNHRFMQESHSHFAFYGWVSAAIYLFASNYLAKLNSSFSMLKYQVLMIINQLGSYGMLITFLYGGYYWLSIVFASVALFTGFAYFIFLLIDTKENKNLEIIWLKAGAFFATISAVGIFGLAYFSSRKEEYEVLFRASTYFYLHYQYNGFFLFSCIGLLLISLKKYDIQISKKLNKNIFYLLFIGCFFGYGLSILWAKIPVVWYLFFTIISLIHLFGAWKLWHWVWKNRIKFSNQYFIQKLLLAVVGFAFLMKFVLQTASAIPSIGVYAFSNINIVIAYLHLVLLLGISLFLIWNIVETARVRINNITLAITLLFLIFGMILNEVLLSIMGVFSIFYIPFPSFAYWLLLASVVIMISIIFFVIRFDFNCKS